MSSKPTSATSPVRNGSRARQAKTRVAASCSRCSDNCDGSCGLFQASLRGPTAGGDLASRREHDGRPNAAVDYAQLDFRSGERGSRGDRAVHALSVVEVGAQYGRAAPLRVSIPVFARPADASVRAREGRDHLAIGAALAGISLVFPRGTIAGEPGIEIDSQGKIVSASAFDGRMEDFRRYHRGLGEILVQVGAEEFRLGIPEYLRRQHAVEGIELVWGETACPGPLKIGSLSEALDLNRRGHTVTPDPDDPVIQAAYRGGIINDFQVHRRSEFADEKGLLLQCRTLRGLGYQRITLAAHAADLMELALLLKWSSRAGIDLVTISGDAALQGVCLHAAAHEFCERLQSRGEPVPDLAFSGGFCEEGQILKALALSAPFGRAVRISRALRIPSAVGERLTQWLNNGGLPKSVRRHGSAPEQIFACWEEVADLVGRREIGKIPLGAIGIYTYAQSLAAGLHDRLAAARRFRLASLRRSDLVSLTPQCAGVTGIPYFMDADRDRAEAILAE